MANSRHLRATTMVALAVSAVLGFTSAGGTQALAGSAPAAVPAVNAVSAVSAAGADVLFTPTVRYLLKQLTVDEKIQLVHGSLGEGIVTPTTPADPGANGAIGVVFGVPRLGIPTIRHADSNGINVFADSTAYPGRLGLAASFDRAGVSQFGRAVGHEGQALGVDLIYAPQLDLTRLPAWARNLTTYGEDPYLSAQLGVADVKAIQRTGLLDQVKHFAFYNGQDQDTPSVIDERAARELYLKPYEAVLREAKPTSVMCSYAKYQIEGVQASPDYACENTFGLKDVLRTDYGT